VLPITTGGEDNAAPELQEENKGTRWDGDTLIWFPQILAKSDKTAYDTDRPINNQQPSRSGPIVAFAFPAALLVLSRTPTRALIHLIYHVVVLTGTGVVSSAALVQTRPPGDGNRRSTLQILLYCAPGCVNVKDRKKAVSRLRSRSILILKIRFQPKPFLLQ
jgi:hypothetical protein